jgi:GINS complex subunit 2
LDPIEKLEELLNLEKTSDFFTEMPNPHYMEITNILLNCAPQDIPRADEVKTLIKDIWDLRIAKLRSSMNEFIKSDSLHAKVNNVTLLEINTVRNLLTLTLKELYNLKQHVTTSDD